MRPGVAHCGLLSVAYLEAYLCRLDLRLRDWRIAINVSKSTAVLFVKSARHIQNARAVQFLREPIQWVETARYPGMTLDTQLTWSTHVNQVEDKVAQRLVACPLLNMRSGLCVRKGVLIYKQVFLFGWITHVLPGGPLPGATSGSCKSYNPIAFVLRLTHFHTLVPCKFTRITGFHSSRTASEHWMRFSSQSPLMRGTPYFGKFKGACADQELTEVTYG
jgi:hypothetical protein